MNKYHHHLERCRCQHSSPLHWCLFEGSCQYN